MPWLALRLEVERAAREAFTDALLEAGAQSASIENDAVYALLGMDQEPGAVVAAAAASARMAAPPFHVETLEDQDWVRASQAQFAPICVGARLWVGPSWHEPPRGRIAVRIDPGLAFGTGSHPSTRLVLEWLDRVVHGGERVLDYGCGSGILAIAAAKLGAAHVDAIDLDPQAIETTRLNAHANGVEVSAALADEAPNGIYDLVLANILAQPLIVLAPLLAPRGARIALSGILESQAQEVADAYARWYDMSVPQREEGWALVVGERR